MAEELAKLLEGHQTELKALSKELLDGDANAFVGSLSQLLASVATGVPALGALAKQGVAKAFALSTQATLERELAKLASEEEKQQFADQIVEPLEGLIGQALVQLVRIQKTDTESVLRALGGLQEEFESFRSEFASRLSSATIVVDTIDVGEGIGILVNKDATKSVQANLIRVRKGTGVVLN